MPVPLYQLKVTLLDCEPPVWRRVIVKRSLNLTQLHRIVQAAMGWKDYHLWEFVPRGGGLAGQRLGEPDPEQPDGTLPAVQVRLNQV